MAYLNAAGSGLPDASVRRRMIDHLRREDEIGPVAAEAEAAEEIAALRPRLAGLIGAEADEIAFLDWGTLAWNAAILSMRLAGRRVLVAPGEWSSNVALLQRLGARIEIMATDGAGRLDIGGIAARIDGDLAGIFLPQVSSLTGERYPAEAIGALDRPDGCLYVVDAAQSLGQMPVSMAALAADILAGPTRKWLRGPKGTGLLAVRRKALAYLAPSRLADDGTLRWPYGPGDARAEDIATARRFEKSAAFAPLRLGLAAALEVYLADPAGIHARLGTLAAHVRHRAARLGLALAGAEPEPSAIVTLQGPAAAIDAMAAAAATAGFTIKRAMPSCEPLRPARTVRGGFLRVSPHVYNSEAEIDALFDVLARAA